MKASVRDEQNFYQEFVLPHAPEWRFGEMNGEASVCRTWWPGTEVILRSPLREETRRQVETLERAVIGKPVMQELSSLRNSAWLTQPQVDTLEAKLADGEMVPSYQDAAPASWVEVANILASFNNWVRLYNIAEEAEKPTPDWWDGTIHRWWDEANSRAQVSLHLNEGAALIIQVPDSWEQFEPGPSFIRHELWVDDVLAAGWELNAS